MAVDLSPLWAIEMLVAAFAGGAFGAAMGAFNAFAFMGLVIVVGEVGDMVAEGSLAVTATIGLGPVFGPHIAFAGGVAATAYAAREGYMDTDFEYHEAKNIVFAHGTKPDVLLVGGAFGVVGYWLAEVSRALSLPWDPLAMAIVLSALVHRVALGYDVLGDASGERFDMGPFERDERRLAADGGARERLVVEPWLGHQYRWPNVALVGAIVGVLSAYIAFETGSAFLAFGITAATLFFLNTGIEQVPVTHHIALVASVAALAAAGGDTASISLLAALLVGLTFGVATSLFAEAFQRVFYAHADTHWDPPAAAIVFGTFLVAVLAMAGLFPGSSVVPVP